MEFSALHISGDEILSTHIWNLSSASILYLLHMTCSYTAKFEPPNSEASAIYPQGASATFVNKIWLPISPRISTENITHHDHEHARQQHRPTLDKLCEPAGEDRSTKALLKPLHTAFHGANPACCKSLSPRWSRCQFWSHCRKWSQRRAANRCRVKRPCYMGSRYFIGYLVGFRLDSFILDWICIHVHIYSQE